MFRVAMNGMIIIGILIPNVDQVAIQSVLVSPGLLKLYYFGLLGMPPCFVGLKWELNLMGV